MTQDPGSPLDCRKAVRPSELARMLGISRALGYRLVAEGTIRSVRVGRAVLVPVSEIDKFLEARNRSEAGGTK
jgi:excisionase family DNA binding protein